MTNKWEYPPLKTRGWDVSVCRESVYRTHLASATEIGNIFKASFHYFLMFLCFFYKQNCENLAFFCHEQAEKKSFDSHTPCLCVWMHKFSVGCLRSAHEGRVPARLLKCFYLSGGLIELGRGTNGRHSFDLCLQVWLLSVFLRDRRQMSRRC